MYNVAGRDRTSDLSNNSRPCNHTEDFVWNWPNYPKFVTNTVDGVQCGDQIAEIFRREYDNLYNSVSYDDRQMATLQELKKLNWP